MFRETMLCPLKDDIWDEWLRAAGPVRSIGTWERRGVPLGIEVPIESHGVFSGMEEEYTARDVEEACCMGLENHTSFCDEFEEAKKELERKMEAGCGVEISWDEAARKDPQDSVSKVALIGKTKQDGSVTRRVVVDLRKAGC